MMILTILAVLICGVHSKYAESWKSLNKRPTPRWYDEAKIGIMMHWGVYSVPAFGTDSIPGEWIYFFMNRTNKATEFINSFYPPETTYEDFAYMFTAELFDPDEWASLFTKAGAKYVVFTSKHHDGFTLFPSKKSPKWNSVEIGPRRDIVREVAKAMRAQNLTFGLYYSLFEWKNPLYLKDANSNYLTQKYVYGKVWPEIKQLVREYKPDVLWSDGEWEAMDVYWRSKQLLTWLYDWSPVKNKIVVNDRWGKGTRGRVGDFYNYGDRFNAGKYLYHKWENAMTLDRLSWGYRRNMAIGDALTNDELIYEVVSTISYGGNILINVGPRQDGTIPEIFQESLLDLGQWLLMNGEAIYGSTPCKHQRDDFNKQVWYTCNKIKPAKLNNTYSYYARNIKRSDTTVTIYVITFKWPKDILEVSDVPKIVNKKKIDNVTLLGYDKPLQWTNDGNFKITFPKDKFQGPIRAWVVKIKIN